MLKIKKKSEASLTPLQLACQRMNAEPTPEETTNTRKENENHPQLREETGENGLPTVSNFDAPIEEKKTINEDWRISVIQRSSTIQDYKPNNEVAAQQ